MGCSDGDTLGAQAVNLMLLQGERQGPAMDEECSARPCATDFSIAAIMARDRQERRERRRHRDPREDTLTPLGEYSLTHLKKIKLAETMVDVNPWIPYY